MKAFFRFQVRLLLFALGLAATMVLLGVPTLWAGLLAFAAFDLGTILALGQPAPGPRPRRVLRLRPVQVYLN
jgi:hypothetical protein